MKTKNVKKEVTTLKDGVDHPFKRLPYRNPGMSQQPNSFQCYILQQSNSHF